MRVAFYLAVLVSLVVLSSCNSEPTLQKYFVENSEKKDFIAVDVAPSIINIDKTKLTAEQKTALESFDKMNILAFKKDSSNGPEFEAESKKVAQLLKGKEYNELMKFGSGKDAASVSFIGDDDDINEFVLYAKRDDNGFAVVRILGDDMDPNKILNIISLLKDSKINQEQLKPLEGLFKK